MNKFLSATLLGVAIGLLIAPKKGAETRHNLADTFDKMKEYINQLLGKASESIHELRASLEHELEGLDDQIKDKVMDIFDEAAKVKEHKKQSQLN